MANEKKTSRKKFRVAVSGSTVDGREISPVHLREAAKNFNPDVYAARVNVEHYLSPCPSSEFSAMGDVTALSTEDITEGPLAGRTALYAEIEPTERMKQLVADGKKIYSSIELHPQFSVNGRAYLVGLAMTDTPASLGTERLKFTAQQRQAVMTFNSVQGEAPLISEAIESEIIEMAEQRQEEGTQWFNRVMGIIGRGRKADDASFSRIQEAVEGVATS
ncbi:TPA: GPO family capsid scaffolding protein, partial [Escherichia coli]|nr:GPO family capsid scaffolding protein [Escherichia coli]